MTSSMWTDRLGGLASATCAAHCFAMAFAPALLSAGGIAFLANDALEWVFFALAVGFASGAAVLGFRVHRTWWVLVGFGLGALVLVAGRLGEAFALYEGGAVLAIVGGALLVAAHVGSAIRTRACRDACAA